MRFLENSLRASLCPLSSVSPQHAMPCPDSRIVLSNPTLSPPLLPSVYLLPMPHTHQWRVSPVSSTPHCNAMLCNALHLMLQNTSSTLPNPYSPLHPRFFYPPSYSSSPFPLPSLPRPAPPPSPLRCVDPDLLSGLQDRQEH